MQGGGHREPFLSSCCDFPRAGEAGGSHEGPQWNEHAVNAGPNMSVYFIEQLQDLGIF